MEEFFDELDEMAWYTGRVIERERAHREGLRHRAVLLFLVNGRNQVLMQKRSNTRAQWPGCWDGGAGGHVDTGELGMFAAIRELKEELGVDVESGDVRYIGAHLSDQKTDKLWNRHFNEFYVAHKDVDIKTIKFNDGEIEDVKWIPWPEFKQWTQSRSHELTGKWEAFDSLVKYMERYIL